MTAVPELLDRFWGIHGAEVRPLSGGMNSQTWAVDDRGSRYVAKRVPSTEAAELEAGCQVAWTLAEAGLLTGRPVSANDGRLVVTEHGLALLEHVPGRELTGETAEEQERIASTLAAVHVAGDLATGPSTAGFAASWLSPELPGVESHPWLVPAFAAVRAETDSLSVSWSVLHTDPQPAAFVHDDDTGITGLIDWSGARRGPVLYDVASTVMYLGGTERATAFLDAYLGHGPLGADELQLLDAFRRLRFAVQGAYFAWRLAAENLTGLQDQAGNEKGLDDARRSLAHLGIETS